MNYKLRGNFTKDSDFCLEEILKNRGVEDLDLFYQPKPECELDYHLLDNIIEGVDMLLKHLKNNSKICLVVDCDVDGQTSASIMWLYIKNIYPNANMMFTVHEGKRHGLEDKIDWLVDGEQFDLVIMPDAGSNDIEFLNRLKEVGTEVLIIDHHNCDYEGYDCVPSNAIIINNQQSERYSNKTLCGAGMAYKFCEALDDKLEIKKAFDYIDLAALGEIADVMAKTTTETNYIMEAGLKNIKNGFFKALLKAQSFSLKEKAEPPYYGLNTTDIAFYIAPILNSIVRVGSVKDNEDVISAFIDPMKIVASTKRGAKPSDTEYICDQVARLGINSKAKQNRIKDKAIDLVDFKIQKDALYENNIIVVELDHETDDIPNTMTGLIAANLVSKYNRPVLLGWRNSENLLRGSMRGNSNFQAIPNLQEFLLKTGFFEYVMGHASAAGYSLDYNKIDDFVKYSNESLPANAFDSCYLVDYALDSDDYDLPSLGYALARHPEYFGNGIDEIKIIVKDIPLGDIFVMGKDKSSIKISCNGIDYVKFKDLDFIDEIMNNRLSKLTVVGTLNLNTFAGKTSLQLFIEDYELNEDSSSKYDF